MNIYAIENGMNYRMIMAEQITKIDGDYNNINSFINNSTLVSNR